MDMKMNISREPSTDVEMSLRREPTFMDIDMKLKKEESLMDVETNLDGAMSTGENCGNLNWDMTMRRKDTVNLTEAQMSFCKNSSDSVWRMDTRKVTRSQKAMSLGKELSHLESEKDINMTSFMNTAMSHTSQATLTNAEMYIKKETLEPARGLESNMSVRTEPSFFGSQFDDEFDTLPVQAKMSVGSEMSQMISVTNIKQEPEESIAGNSSGNEYGQKTSRKQKMHDEDTDTARKKAKLVVKLKRKSRFKSKLAPRHTKRAQIKSEVMMDCESASMPDPEVVIKCEPMWDSETYAECNSESVAQSCLKGKKGTASCKQGRKKRRPAACTHCQQNFCSRSSLKRHYKRKHSNDNMPLTCKYCNITFSQYLQLRAHERTHKGREKTFPCQECDVVFTRACHLKVHMRKHTGERPYSCNHCSATFRSTSNLNRHLMKHSGLRPYVCTVCNADFYQSSHLVSHVRKHTGERPFKCTQCSSTFTQLTHLHRHMAKHTGKKPYLCKECGMGFVENCALKRHMKTHNKKGNSTGTRLTTRLMSRKTVTSKAKTVQ